MVKRHYWVILIFIILFLGLLYPISVYSSYFLSQSNSIESKIRNNGTEGPVIYSDNQTQDYVIQFATYYPSNERDYAPSQAILFGIAVNYTKIPPFRAYGKSSTGTVTNLGILDQYNISLSIDLVYNYQTIKHIDDVISLNNKTTNLSLTRVYTWTPPSPHFSTLFGHSYEKQYQAQVTLSVSDEISNKMDIPFSPLSQRQGSIFITWGTNYALIFEMYSFYLLTFLLLFVTIFVLIEFRKYSLTPDQKSSFITYLSIKISKYSKNFHKAKESQKKFTPQTISNKTLKKLEEIEEEN